VPASPRSTTHDPPQLRFAPVGRCSKPRSRRSPRVVETGDPRPQFPGSWVDGGNVCRGGSDAPRTMRERMAVREHEHLPWGSRNRLGLAGARMSQAVMSASSAPVATVETLDVSCREPQAEDGPGVV
jgi:hypothetical protein